MDQREVIAHRYELALADVDVLLPPGPAVGTRHARHLFPIRVERRREIYDAMQAAGIGVQVHHVPIHHHPAYAFGTDPADLPHTEAAYAHLLSLPLFPDLRDDEQRTVIDALEQALESR